MKKNVLFLLITILSGALLVGCGSISSWGSPSELSTDRQDVEPMIESESTKEIQVFAAASLNSVMQELIKVYNEEQPDVKVTINADSSGKLLTQIEEGFECDIFFSAAQKQMDQLEKDGLILADSRKNVLNNQLVVITRNGSGTKVTGLETLGRANSISLAGGSVPAGKYTRQALVSLGMVKGSDDVSVITAKEVSDALGGVEISEQDNVSKVLMSVIEGSCEVGTTYLSDTYGYESQLTILQTVDSELTGDVIYPICRVSNQAADDDQVSAADDFYRFILSDKAKMVFDRFGFDTNLVE